MYTDVKEKMDKAIIALENDYAAIRAGRANPALLDKVTVDYYGTPTPVPQVGSVSVPEARMLVIQPWDASILGDIEKAILKSEITRITGIFVSDYKISKTFCPCKNDKIPWDWPDRSCG